MATATNFHDIPLEVLEAIEPGQRVQLDLDMTGTVLIHQHRSRQLRVRLHTKNQAELLVTYDAVERIY